MSGRDIDAVPADRYTITTSGAIVFEDGDIFDSTLVIAYASGEWQKVLRYEPEKHGSLNEMNL